MFEFVAFAVLIVFCISVYFFFTCCYKGRCRLKTRNNDTSSSTVAPTTTGRSTTVAPTTTGPTTVSQIMAPDVGPHQSAHTQHNYSLQEYGHNNFIEPPPPYTVHSAYPPHDPHAAPSYTTLSAPPPSYDTLLEK